jgi:hypothetical protein
MPINNVLVHLQAWLARAKLARLVLIKRYVQRKKWMRAFLKSETN